MELVYAIYKYNERNPDENFIYCTYKTYQEALRVVFDLMREDISAERAEFFGTPEELKHEDDSREIPNIFIAQHIDKFGPQWLHWGYEISLERKEV